MVDAIDEHRRGVLRRRGLHDPACTSRNVFLAGFLGQEKARALQYNIGTDLIPFQVGRVTLGGDADRFAVHDQVAALSLYLAIEQTVHGIVLEHVGQVVRVKQVIDANNLHVLEFPGDGAKRHATDTAEAVDSHFNRHMYFPPEFCLIFVVSFWWLPASRAAALPVWPTAGR